MVKSTNASYKNDLRMIEKLGPNWREILRVATKFNTGSNDSYTQFVELLKKEYGPEFKFYSLSQIRKIVSTGYWRIRDKPKKNYLSEEGPQCIEYEGLRSDIRDSFINYQFRHARILAGVTRKKLVEVTGIPYRSLISYERLRCMPSKGRAKSIVKAINDNINKPLKGPFRRKVREMLEERLGGAFPRNLTVQEVFPKEYLPITYSVKNLREDDYTYEALLVSGFLELSNPQRIDEKYTEESNCENPERKVDQVYFSADLQKIINGYLGEKEAKVVSMRHGLDGSPPLGLEDVGKILRLYPERVRQIEMRALGKLQRCFKREGINDYSKSFSRMGTPYLRPKYNSSELE